MGFTSETAKKAGEKSKRGESVKSKIINEMITDDDREKLVNLLRDLAFTGDVKCLELILAYLFGKPQQQMDLTTQGEKINNVLNIGYSDHPKDDDKL